MGPADIIVLIVLLLIVAAAIAYILHAKKSGKRCCGCPDAGSCGKSCSGCSGTHPGCSNRCTSAENETDSNDKA